ncbi:MAG: pentapeptide repeat-containing protein [Chloroflexota bacterium]
MNKQSGYQPPKSTEELVQRYNAGERYFSDIDIADGSDLSNTRLDNSTFFQGYLTDIDFRGASLRHVRFLDCNVKCSNFQGADLEGAVFKGSSVEAAYFGNANLTNVSFAGAHFCGYELKESDMPDEQGLL